MEPGQRWPTPGRAPSRLGATRRSLDGRRNGILTVGHCRRFTRKILIEAAEAAVVVAVHLGRRGHRRRIVDVRRCL